MTLMSVYCTRQRVFEQQLGLFIFNVKGGTWYIVVARAREPKTLGGATTYSFARGRAGFETKVRGLFLSFRWGTKGTVKEAREFDGRLLVVKRRSKEHARLIVFTSLV